MIYAYATSVFITFMLVSTVLLLLAERYLANYGTCKIDINSGHRTLEISGGVSLLSTLIEQQIYIPSACGGHGTCGFCKVHVVSGGGPILPTETTFLTRTEQRANLRLACQVKVKQDMQIKIPEEMLNVKLFSAKIQSTRSVTHDIKEISMSLVGPLEINQRPGQYVQIQVPTPDGPVFRAYSISSPTYENNRVQLNVRIVPGGAGSTYLHNLKENDPVSFTGPYGEFVLNEDPTVEIVCVGGGCGMAPMKNIIYSLYSKWPDRVCWLFFGCRTTKDIFYLDEFKELAAKHPKLQVVYSLSDSLKPDETWSGERGFIHLAVDKHLKAEVKRQAFLCGPPPMIDAVTVVLGEKGIASGDIFYDKF
jgi:Na+-transporting NADH:ubiquinone oxidoreductase subunit F